MRLNLKKILAVVLCLCSGADLFSKDNSLNEIVKDQKKYENFKMVTIPAKVKWQVTENIELTPDQLEDDKFVETTSHFNPGIYKGIIWLDLEFPVTIDKYGYDYLLDFRYEPVDYAELFLQRDDQWISAGATGRSLPNDKISLPSVRHSISFNEFPYRKEKTMHLRAKIHTSMGTPVIVSVYPANGITYMTHASTIWHLLFCGFFIAIFIFVLSYGFFYKDSTFIYLGLTCFSILLVSLELNGVGARFIWNNLSVKFYGTRLFYFFVQMTVIFYIRTLMKMLKEHESMLKLRILFHVAAAVTIIILLSFFIVWNDMTLYFIQAAGFLIQLILIEIILVTNIPPRKHQCFDFIAATIAFDAGAFIIQLFHIMRIFNHSRLFMLFDTCSFYILDIFFVLSTISISILMAKRITNSYTTAKTEMNRQKKINAKIMDNQKLYTSVLNEFYDDSFTRQNALTVNEIRKLAESNSLISELCETSTESYIILHVFHAIENNSAKSEKYIKLLDFFNSCIEKSKNRLETRSIITSVTTTIPDDIFIMADPILLEYIFNSTTIELSKRMYSGAKMILNIVYSQGNIKFSIKTKKQQTRLPSFSSLQIEYTPGTDNKTECQSGIGLHLVKKALELYNGTMDFNTSDREFELSAQFNVKECIKNEKSDDIVSTAPSKEFFDMATDGASRSELIIPDDLLTVNGTPMKIFMVENNDNLMQLYTRLISPHATILGAYDGHTALSMLQEMKEQNKLPDIIMSENAMPVTTGLMLFKTLRDNHLIDHIPFILILSSDDDNHDSVYLAQGVTAVLRKPFSMSQVMSLLTAISTIRKITYNEIMGKISGAFNVSFESGKNEGNDTEDVKLPKPVSKNLTAQQKNEFSQAELSKREQQIALLIADGKSDKQIAEELKITAATVATHNKKLFKKMGVHSRIELMNRLK